MIFTFDYLFYLLECFCLDVKQNILFLSCIYSIYIYIYIYILGLSIDKKKNPAINHMIVMS